VRWFRTPLLHFLAGGAVLFWLVHRAFPATPGGPPTSPIVVTAADVAQLRTAYTRETGLQPTAADEAALIERAVEEELLFREAVARGLDRNDRSVRNWLIEQMRVLADDADGDEDDLYARARALELDRKDLVVRRILVQKMRLLASRAGEQDVTDDELRAFYAQHEAEYRLPERVSLWQVFFGSQRRGEDAQREAERLLAELRNRPTDAAATGRRGDTFPLPPHLIGQSRQQLAKVFGADFAAQVMRGDSRTWIGPLASPYGVHLVWIDDQERGASPSFESVRGRVLESWHEARRAERLARLIRELETRYPLRVESAAWRDRRGA
jgi:hypothetical protein